MEHALSRVQHIFSEFRQIADAYEYAMLLEQHREVHNLLVGFSHNKIRQASQNSVFPLIFLYQEGSQPIFNMLAEGIFGNPADIIETYKNSQEGVFYDSSIQTFVLIQSVSLRSGKKLVIGALLNPEILSEYLSAYARDLRQAGYTTTTVFIQGTLFKKVLGTPLELPSVGPISRELQVYGQGYLAYSHIKLLDGSPANLGCQLSSTEIFRTVYPSLSDSLILAFFVALIISLILWQYLERKIIRPLEILRSSAENMRIHQNYHSIELDREDELGDLIRTYNHLLHDFIESQKKLKQINDNLTTHATDGSRTLKSFLDNSSQGILCFDHRFHLQPEFSRECFKIFGHDLQPQDLILNRLFRNAIHREIYEDWLNLAFDQKINFVVIGDSCPSYIQIQRKLYRLEWRLLPDISQAKVLLLISDTSPMQSDSDKTNKLARTLLRILEHRDDFRAYLQKLQSWEEQFSLVMKAGDDLNACLSMIPQCVTLSRLSRAFYLQELNFQYQELHQYLLAVKLKSRPLSPVVLRKFYEDIAVAYNGLKDAISRHLKDLFLSSPIPSREEDFAFIRVLKLLKDEEIRRYNEEIKHLTQVLMSNWALYTAYLGTEIVLLGAEHLLMISQPMKILPLLHQILPDVCQSSFGPVTVEASQNQYEVSILLKQKAPYPRTKFLEVPLSRIGEFASLEGASLESKFRDEHWELHLTFQKSGEHSLTFL
ncbi:MAG: hypothetical protein H3C47_16135 [Candidatus Cloacimonetes bacterium]|nr:hypothetical protein [Candidatus Cloacimonadota bacterium]